MIRANSRHWSSRSALGSTILSSARECAGEREPGSIAWHQIAAGRLAGLGHAPALRRAQHRHVRLPRDPPRCSPRPRNARADLRLEYRNADAGCARGGPDSGSSGRLSSPNGGNLEGCGELARHGSGRRAHRRDLRSGCDCSRCGANAGTDDSPVQAQGYERREMAAAHQLVALCEVVNKGRIAAGLMTWCHPSREVPMQKGFARPNSSISNSQDTRLPFKGHRTKRCCSEWRPAMGLRCKSCSRAITCESTAFVLRLVGNATFAEDLTSEVFLDVWRQAHRFKAPLCRLDLAAGNRPQQGGHRAAPPAHRSHSMKRRGRSRIRPTIRKSNCRARSAARFCAVASDNFRRSTGR